MDDFLECMIDFKIVVDKELLSCYWPDSWTKEFPQLGLILVDDTMIVRQDQRVVTLIVLRFPKRHGEL